MVDLYYHFFVTSKNVLKRLRFVLNLSFISKFQEDTWVASLFLAFRGCCTMSLTVMVGLPRSSSNYHNKDLPWLK